MKTNKFKAWDKKKKMWTNYQIYLLDGSIRYMDKNIGTWHSDPNHERFVLTQYTGLDDRNGIEIYEGYILDCSYVNPMSKKVVEKLFLVKFIDGTYMAKLIGHSPYGDTALYFTNKRGTVIGNVFENPELLEVK